MANAIVDIKSISEAPTGLELWNKLEFTDQKYTKPYDTGGFKGTAIDPIYNLKRVSEQLGPVGFNWGWKVLNERLDTFGSGNDAVTMHSLTLRAWFLQDDGSIREVDHIGHTKVSYRTRSGAWRVDEEFGKKSLTDALSKIMMSLGASADIWLGRFDGNKYVPPAAEASTPEPDTTMKSLVHIADENGEVICTTSQWQEALRRYGEIKKAAKDKPAMREANVDALRQILNYVPEKSDTRKKLASEIKEIEAGLLPGAA
jgi:hypothetical protein